MATFKKIYFSTLFLLMSTGISFAQQYYLLIGTYTNTGSKGIYVYNFNAQNGELKWVSNTDSSSNPSFLAVSQNEKYVYAVNETSGSNPGRVSAYSFDKKNGKLNFLNTTFSGGDDPCHLATTRDNKWLTVANYSSGTASVFPIDAQGHVKPFTQLIYDSIYLKNGEKATSHVHETVFSPDEKFLMTPDLGLDKVFIYHFKPEQKKPLVLASPGFVASQKGNGPRHMAFHPNGKFVYVMHEMGGNVTAYRYANGSLNIIEDLKTYPSDFSGRKDGAEVEISSDGKFLYVSNRGDLNSIAIFSIDTKSGKLSLKGYQPTFGKAPRHFILDPTGKYLLVAHQDTDNIVIFQRDQHTGLLKKMGKEIKLPRPVCLEFISKK